VLSIFVSWGIVMYGKLKKELNKLWTGELASVLAFWMCYFIWAKDHTIQIIYPLSVLCLILVQGSVYWLICLNRLTRHKNCFNNVGKFFGVLKYLDMALLFAYILILLISPIVPFKYYFVGIFLGLFGLVEFINYFLYRLSYKNIVVLISQIKSQTLKKSRLAKEIEKARL
jgi:hypothetical protein